MTGVPKSVREAMIEAAWLLIAERGLEGMSTRISPGAVRS
jgi:AcrR family transcriptional regulator